MSDHTIDRQQTTSPSSDPRTLNRARFELELEFVQSLANPFYIHSLAQQNILEQPTFINFLKYLLYFKEKDYARFIQSDFGVHIIMLIILMFTCVRSCSYPHALHHLDLLQHARFRSEMKKDESFREYLHQKQFDHWRTW
jgi:mediator of RNA polymerase II transcription subunit 31